MKYRVFADSGLEIGLQESIITISAYVAWFLGVLGALNALGFSGTSLTVAFGALGVGLGFGLQNIFNNFISGMILLFERPIQVGDAIEIDGTWGEVRKINVRSTVIQTWDNASLIIPNSEFISGRVTNWSFKDLSLRRNINVGVAYGSDIERVRETLLEIAHAHPQVYKNPEPSVLFTDFGDSALIFRLRVWTTIDECLRVETDIRFEIDRLFRERGIEIAFPQRDIHIRSMVPCKQEVVNAPPKSKD
ncbi:MAG: potassium transporter KefA [Bacteroidetes bacterium]|nr:MAG: potassium transporter KefA [Bacteroidota bacterium]